MKHAYSILLIVEKNKMRIYYLSIVLLLFATCSSAQSSFSNEAIALDSLISGFEAQIIDNFDTIRLKEIHQDISLALKEAKRLESPKLVSKAHATMSLWYLYNVHEENRDSAVFHNERSLFYVQQTQDKEAIAEAHSNLGYNLAEIGRYEDAESNLFQAVQIYEELNLFLALGFAYTNLAELYRETNDGAQAISYAEKAFALIEEHKEGEFDILEPLRVLVRLYPPELALEKAQQIIDVVYAAPADRSNLGLEKAHAIHGRAMIFHTLERYDEALQDYRTALSLVEEIAIDKRHTNGWKGGIADVLFLQKKYAQAIPYFRDYITHVEERNMGVYSELVSYKVYLAECYKQTNQLDSAFVYLNQGKTLESKLLEEELAAVKNELRIKYDTEQKEETIATQSTQIQQQKRIQQLSFGIGGLLTLLLSGLFLTYLNNRKRNLRLQELNENLEDSNLQLDQRNAQNELLLKEIHHRVKNNLETVSSLLELQSAQVENDEIQSVMQASQSRVQSMSILHQKLYQGENLASIEMKDYFKNLAESVLDTYDVWEQVEIEYDMQPLELDVDTAVPIGLIVNELLTNTLKYAFPDGEKGKVYLSLKATDQKTLQLVVADNGVGKTVNVESKGTGFGSQLVALLTRQLNGTMREENGDGMKVVFEFKSFHKTE